MWDRIKYAIKTYVIKPFMSQHTPGSIGRLLLTITFFSSLFRFWVLGDDPPDTMMQVLFACIAYVFGGKVVNYKKYRTDVLAASPAGKLPQTKTEGVAAQSNAITSTTKTTETQEAY